MRKLLSHVERTLAVFFGNASRSLEQLQDGLTRLVELIGPIRRVAAGSPRITPDLAMHRSALPMKWINLIVWSRLIGALAWVPSSFVWACSRLATKRTKSGREIRPKVGDFTLQRVSKSSLDHRVGIGEHQGRNYQVNALAVLRFIAK
jgi:hypothetical protein